MIEKNILGFCYCGCGKKTKLATKTSTRMGHKKGDPFKYLKGHRSLPNYSKSALQMRDGDNRLCKVCEKWKHNDDFYKHSGYICKICRAEQIKLQKLSFPDFNRRQKSRALKRRYGITLEEWEEILASQDHKCKICLKILKSNNTATDHCHDTKKFRGIICYGCNFALGAFKDDIVVMQRAMEYVKKGGL